MHLKCKGLEPFIRGLGGAAHSSGVTLNSSSQEATVAFESSRVKHQKPAACSLSGPACGDISEGKVHAGNFSVHHWYPIHLQFTEQFFFLTKKRERGHNFLFAEFPRPLSCSVVFVFLFFPSVASLACGFSHQSQRTGSVSS